MVDDVREHGVAQDRSGRQRLRILAVSELVDRRGIAVAALSFIKRPQLRRDGLALMAGDAQTQIGG